MLKVKVFFFYIFLVYGLDAQTYTFHDKDSTLTLQYDVQEGYKTTIQIKDSQTRLLYKSYFEADFSKPYVEFLDLNEDKKIDIVIKLTSEGEYKPVVLLQQSDTFISALPQEIRFYFNREIYNRFLFIEGKKNPKPEFWLENRNSKYKSLIFENLYIDNRVYYNVVLNLNDLGNKYYFVKDFSKN